MKFAAKVKKELRSLYQISTEESLRDQAKGEGTLKNKNITAKSVSYMMGNNSNVKSAVKCVDSVKRDRKTENY